MFKLANSYHVKERYGAKMLCDLYEIWSGLLRIERVLSNILDVRKSGWVQSKFAN